LAKYPTFWDFWNFVCTKEVTGDVDLRGCDLSKIKIPEKFKDKIWK
jgi:hypothetical protein